MGLKTSTKPFEERIAAAAADKFATASIAQSQDAQYVKREGARSELGHWQEWRQIGQSIRQHAINYLPDYLEEFSDHVDQRGGSVFFAQTPAEANAYILNVLKEQESHHVVKSKSMVTSELDLDQKIQALPDTTVLETDLAEFILQEDNWDEPSHIVFPALHKNRDQVKAEFEKIGYVGDNDPEKLARFARHYLRERFLEADVGITGCNFAIADTGMINLNTNEGNADLVDSIPETQIVVMGMERIVPSMKEAEIMDNLLARSAVGQRLTTYVTFAGPKAQDEADGPTNFHVVILDNNRSEALGTEFQEILQCIRCGACLNVCPVYRHLGGHGYGSLYPGPVGAVLSPILGGYEQFGELPFASSLCGACTETCPVLIPLHPLLIKHREVETDRLKMMHGFKDTQMKIVGKATASPFLFKMGLQFKHFGMQAFTKHQTPTALNFFAYQGAMIKNGPGLIKGWTDVRDLPQPPKHKDDFRVWFEHHQANQGGATK